MISETRIDGSVSFDTCDATPSTVTAFTGGFFDSPHAAIDPAMVTKKIIDQAIRQGDR
jgi:hypothetical protein